MIRALIAGELRHHARDRVTLAVLVLGQGLVYPILGFGVAQMQREGNARAEVADITVSVVGDADRLARHADAHTRLVAAETDPLAPVHDGRVDALIELSEAGEPFAADVRFTPRTRNGNNSGRRAADLAKEAGRGEREAAFRAASAPPPDRVLDVEFTDRVDPLDRTLRKVASLVPTLLLFLVASCGIYTALDVVTGERERGTAETLLTTAADRAHIAIAKTVVVLGMVMLSSVLSLTSLWLTAISPIGIDLVGEARIPFSAFLTVLVLFVPLAATLAAVLTAAAARVTDFKSGQVATLPALLVPAGLSALAMNPDVTLTPVLALVPFANLSIAMREVLLRTASPLPLLIAGLSSVGWAALSLWATARWLGREDVLVGDRAGVHRRLRGDYGPDAAVAYLVALCLLWFIGVPAQAADFVGGMAITQFALLLPLGLAVPVLVGLPLRRTLAWTRPRASDLAWAVGIGFMCPTVALSVAALQTPLLPMSADVFRALEAIFPGDLPFPLMIGLIAVAPALCEELLFRGCMQGLLERSMRPWLAAAVTAVAFGLFHVSLFRVLPTAAIGLLLGFVRMRTGSILPCMLIHFMNNALIVSVTRMDVDVSFAVPMLGGAALAYVAVFRMGR